MQYQKGSKAIIATHNLLDRETNILTVAVNYAQCKADYRVVRDCLGFKSNLFTEHLIMLDGRQYKQSDKPNDGNDDTLYFYAGTLTTAIDFCIKKVQPTFCYVQLIPLMVKIFNKALTKA